MDPMLEQSKFEASTDSNSLPYKILYDAKFQLFDEKYSYVNTRLDTLERNFQSKIDAQRMWIIGLIGAIIALAVELLNLIFK